MPGTDFLAVVAVIVSLLVAIGNVIKEWHEVRKARTEKYKAEKDEQQDDYMLPIRGASDAVVALQRALAACNANEDRLRKRIVYLEEENTRKDERISQLEQRMWSLERKLGSSIVDIEQGER
jgi:uncharacterized membrane protein YcjF (UPF0283 family)